MSSPYTSTTVSGYNTNPPPDDGTTGANNLITWAGVKTKLGDPLNTFASSVNSNLVTAFGKVFGGGSVVTTAVDYAAGAADQGRLIRVTVASKTVTTPDATSVNAPFTFVVTNGSASGINVAGFGGTQTVDGSASISIPAAGGCILYTDGANWFTTGQFAISTNVTIPQGRLTLTSGTPVLSGDVTAATAVYYTPYIGNQIPIPNGTTFIGNNFTELTLTLNNVNYVANTIYDVFVFLNSGTVTIGTGPAWSTSTAGSGARGTGAGTTELTRLNGMYTNNVSITARNNATTYSVSAKSATYVGSIFLDGTNGQISCHFSTGQNRKFGLWNAYNRNKIVLRVLDTTASWDYSTNAFRASNNSTNNKFTCFTGLAEEWVDCFFKQRIRTSASGTGAFIGLGVNSTTVASGIQPAFSPSSDTVASLATEFSIAPGLGINNVTSLESGNGTITATFSGTSANMICRGQWMG